jgi:hypothetical protein
MVEQCVVERSCFLLAQKVPHEALDLRIFIWGNEPSTAIASRPAPSSSASTRYADLRVRGSKTSSALRPTKAASTSKEFPWRLTVAVFRNGPRLGPQERLVQLFA